MTSEALRELDSQSGRSYRLPGLMELENITDKRHRGESQHGAACQEGGTADSAPAGSRVKPWTHD